MSEDGNKADSKGRLNPFSITPQGAGPQPENQPESRDVPEGPSSGRYEVPSGKSVKVGDKAEPPGLASPESNPFLQEDKRQLSRQLTPQSIQAGFRIVKRKGLVGFADTRKEADE
jgi:hypothetical protein